MINGSMLAMTSLSCSWEKHIKSVFFLLKEAKQVVHIWKSKKFIKVEHRLQFLKKFLKKAEILYFRIFKDKNQS